MDYSMATAQFIVTEIVGIVAYVTLNRDNLRFGRIPTVMLLGICIVTYFLPKFSGSNLIVLAYFFIMLAALVKRNPAGAVTLQFTYYALGNILGNTLIAAFYSIYSSMHGGLKWLDTGDQPVTVAAAVLVLAALSLVAGLYFTILLKPTIISFTGGMKLFACGTLSTGILLSTVLKTILLNNNEYVQNPYGIGVFLDFTALLMDSIVIVMTIAITIHRKRQERRLIEASVNKEYEAYKEIEELQNDIRMLNHDIRNLQTTAESSDALNDREDPVND